MQFPPLGWRGMSMRGPCKRPWVSHSVLSSETMQLQMETCTIVD